MLVKSISLVVALLSLCALVSSLGCRAAGPAQNAAKPAAIAPAKARYPMYWPPSLNTYYPDIEMMSISGKPVRLSSYAGKVILVEPIGMSCPACQTFAGGDRAGGINGVTPQIGAESADKMLTGAVIKPSDPRLIRVQLLLYGPNMQAPTLAEAQAWAKHFGFGQKPNEVVLIADSRHQNNASYNMIPGYQLIDKSFVMRSDACGHNPQNALYDHLLPILKKNALKCAISYANNDHHRR